jgi:hypothetical protein
MATKSKAKKSTAKKTTTKKATGKGKTAQARKMLSRPGGATREQILKFLGWKAVSIQQIAGKTVLLKLEKPEGKPTVYRV